VTGMTSDVMAPPQPATETGAMPATSPLSPTTTAEPTPWRERLTLLVLLSGTFMVVLDFFIVNVALPSVQHDLGASDATLQWIVAGYGLANAAGLVTGGRLGDLFGRRRMFMLGLLLFSLASLACGLAPNGPLLVAARVVQGLAGALLQPQVLAILGLVYTGPARAKAFAGYGLALGLGAGLGQLVGGGLIAADLFGLGWRNCFLINLPIGAAALLLAPRLLPPLDTPGASRLDLVGTALVAATSIAVVLPLVQGRELGWPAWSLGLLAAAVPLGLLFLRQQRALKARGGAPLVAPALLAIPAFRIGLLTTLAFYMGNASLYFVLALQLQQVLHLPPFTSGLAFTAMAAAFVLASMKAPKLAARLGGSTVLPGAWMLAAGHLLQWANLHLAGGHVLWGLVPLLSVQGIGLGLLMAPLVSTVLAGLPPQHAGVASGVLAMVQQSGNALGVALIGLVFHAGGFAASLLALAAGAVAVALLSTRLRQP
jgi:EmrB/QacA subfamily drug resistance transporter